ncbi:hypothetical protein BDQ17DRAFT_1425847 [Cyathus striatus]|nr:hypothetical protein BDQ17DRAFT_1425847 [Cyathus striatus]
MESPIRVEKTQVTEQNENIGCLFIPTRWAQFAAMTILLAIGVAYAVTGWIAGDKLNIQLTDVQRVAVIFHIFMYILLTFGSMYGIYAAIVNYAKRARYVVPLLLSQLPFSIASGALCLFVVFHPSNATPTESGGQLQSDFDRCSALLSISPNDGFLKEMCGRTDLIKGVCIGLFIFGWLFQMLAIYTSWVYSTGLREIEQASESSDSKYETDADSYC